MLVVVARQTARLHNIQNVMLEVGRREGGKGRSFPGPVNKQTSLLWT